MPRGFGTHSTREITCLRAPRAPPESPGRQLAAGGEIKRLEAQWYGLVDKNMDIALGCKQLEEEVAKMREECTKKGLALPHEVTDEDMME